MSYDQEFYSEMLSRRKQRMLKNGKKKLDKNQEKYGYPLGKLQLLSNEPLYYNLNNMCHLVGILLFKQTYEVINKKKANLKAKRGNK